MKKLVAEFEMKYLGMMHYFLGLEVWKSPDEIFLNQGNYIVEIVKRLGMLDCKDIYDHFDDHKLEVIK